MGQKYSGCSSHRTQGTQIRGVGNPSFIELDYPAFLTLGYPAFLRLEYHVFSGFEYPSLIALVYPASTDALRSSNLVSSCSS
jgi:hypothetical protein